MKSSPPALASAVGEIAEFVNGCPLAVNGPMLSSTVLSTRSTSGRWDSVRRSPGL